MSIRAMAWAFDQACPTPAAKLVLIKLADHADDDGECWPSQSRIAADCGLTRQYVNQQMGVLERLGLIEREQRVSDRGQQTNRYFLRCKNIRHPLSEYLTPPLSDNLTPPVRNSDTEPSIEPSKEDSVPAELPPDEPAASEADPVGEIFDRGLRLLGPRRRSLLGRMRKDHGDEAVLAAIIVTEAECPSEPAAFMLGCLARAGPRPAGGKHPGTYRPSPAAALYEGAYLAAQAYSAKHGLDQPAGEPVVVPLLDRCRSG